MLHAAGARCFDAMERVRMQGEVRRLEAEAHRLEEEERRRIGRDLHDETGQSLVLLRLQLEMMEKDAPDGLRQRLAQARLITEGTVVELRRTIAALSPAVVERLGLEAALRQLAARFRKQLSADVRLRISPGIGELSTETQDVIYRVAKEALQNVVKHSQATTVKLLLGSADKKIRLSVQDNGAGFSPETARGKRLSFGLTVMQERAALLGGTLMLRSAPGKGATVILELPRGPAKGSQGNVKNQSSSHRRSCTLPAGHTDPARRRNRYGSGRRIRQRLDAVAMAQQVRPDVVLMDIGMPGMSSFEATRQIRKDRPETQGALSLHVRRRRLSGRVRGNGRQRLHSEG